MSDLRDAQIEILRIMGSRIEHEHALINGRMTWLMTLNGLLIAAIGVVLTVGTQLAEQPVAVLLVSICTLGALSNWSVLYSHYWASRAIKEAELTARWAIDSDRLRQAIRPPEAMFRLFGRGSGHACVDGQALHSSPWHPLWPANRLVHPWFFLPILGSLLFPTLAIAFRRLPVDEKPDYIAPLLLTMSPAIVLTTALILFLLGRAKEETQRHRTLGNARRRQERRS